MIRIAAILVLLLCSSGCTIVYQHSYEATISPPLPTDAVNPTLEKVKYKLVEGGAIVLPSPKPEAVLLRLNSGSAGLLRSPFNDNLAVEISKDANSARFHLRRIISHPIDFGEERLRAIVAHMDKVMSEFTERQVKFSATPGK